MTVLFLVPWLTYLLAQGMELSGIASILFCGFTMAQYALPNLTQQGQKQIKRFYNVVAYNFENLVFVFIGMSLFGYNLQFKYFF